MVEELVCRNVSKSEKVVQWVLRSMTVFLGLVGMITIVMLPAFFVALATTTYYSKRLYVEYEYGFDKYNGILTIDRILKGKKRQSCLYTDMNDLMSICPYSVSDVGKDKHEKVEDFASRNPNAKVYVIKVKQKGKVRSIIFEPGDELLENIQTHASCKVII